MKQTCILFLAAMSVGHGSALGADGPAKPITLGGFGHRRLPRTGRGDTWDSAWLANDKVYLQQNDGRGFPAKKKVRGGGHHDRICELMGTPEDMSSISGVNLNPGILGAFLGKTYSTGIYEVDGILYHNLCYSVQKPGAWRFYNGSAIKSVDGGANWINHLGQTNVMPRKKTSECMYPDDRWHQVNFVKYGRGGAAPDIDNARTFVYLNSRWKGAYHLARIKRKDLPALDTKKIQFYQGGDGMLDESWTDDISKWAAITNKENMPPTSVVYNYGLRRYLSIAFRSDSWIKPPKLPVESSFYLLEAPHPWGPWTLVLEENMNHREGDNLTWTYLLQKFTSGDGTKMWTTTCGRKPYGLQFIPVYLTTHPVQSYDATNAKPTGTVIARDKEGHTGKGYVSGFDAVGDKCVFTVKAEGEGAHILNMRYNTPKCQKLDFLVNGTHIEELKLGKSEQVYATWTWMSMFAWFKKGDNTVSFRCGTAGESSDVNLDSLSLAFYSKEPGSLPNCGPPAEKR